MSSLFTLLAEHLVAMICALTVREPLEADSSFTLWWQMTHYLQQQIPLINSLVCSSCKWCLHIL